MKLGFWHLLFSRPCVVLQTPTPVEGAAARHAAGAETLLLEIRSAIARPHPSTSPRPQ